MFTHGRTHGRRIERYTISSPCEPSVKIQKKNLGVGGGVGLGGGGGVRVDVNEELKFL